MDAAETVAEAPRWGHNERTARLGLLAEDARHALARAQRGEEEAIAGWLAYGAVLNEGRALFPGDREFGEWVAQSQVGIAADGHPIKMDERAAAMWAAANPDQFAEARAAGNARTVRGIHAKWKELDAHRLAERETARARRRVAEMDAERPRPSPARDVVCDLDPPENTYAPPHFSKPSPAPSAPLIEAEDPDADLTEAEADFALRQILALCGNDWLNPDGVRKQDWDFLRAAYGRLRDHDRARVRGALHYLQLLTGDGHEQA